ncbi:MAG: DMT family transporter [Pseudomonadota bacterium]
MDITAIAMGLVFAVIWSSAFTSARIIVADAPPLFALSLRYLISGLIGVGIAAALGQPWRLSPSQWRAAAIFGIFQFGIYLGTNFWAMQTVEASFAAIIASTMPLLVSLASWIVLKEHMSPLGLLGLGLGFAGVFLIMGARLNAGVDPFGTMLCIIGVLSLTISTMAVKNAAAGDNVLMVVGIQMLIGAVFLAPVSLSIETIEITWSWPLIIAFLYTTLFPGLIATFVWFLLVKRIGAMKASTFHFLNPVFGVAIAALFLSEALGPTDLLGVIIVTAGILAVQIAKQR